MDSPRIGVRVTFLNACPDEESPGLRLVCYEGSVPDPEYVDYPGGKNFEPWQDHEWPDHCGLAAEYFGEVGKRELDSMSGGDILSFLDEHDVHRDGPRLTLDHVPPHAPKPGEAWDSTIHHFRCPGCGWDLLIWDAN